MSFWQYLGAIASKQLVVSTPTKPLVFTKTPIPELTQRSLVELEMVPFILAQSAGSLFRDISGHHSIIGVSKMNYIGFDFYRAYLSKDDGSFIHLAVDPRKPTEILEQRIYQPYNEIVPLWANRVDQVATLPTYSWWRSGDTDYPVTVLPDEYSLNGIDYQYVTYTDTEGAVHKTGVPKTDIIYTTDPVDESLNWEFWLLENPDPNVGGMIGCPVIQGKNEDIDPKTGVPNQYMRTWVASNQRIDPVVVTERLIDLNGETTVFNHTMMHYSRQIDDKIEYLLVSCVEVDGRAYVNMWLGLDIASSDMKIFAVGA